MAAHASSESSSRTPKIGLDEQHRNNYQNARDAPNRTDHRIRAKLTPGSQITLKRYRRLAGSRF